jgi:sodium-dependent dicarboxylate transporter 2/3/5
MILPISTPPNALAYATNLIQQKDMARMGIIIGLISVVLGYLILFAAGSLHIV